MEEIKISPEDKMISAMTLRRLKSPEFMIATKSIFDLYEKLENWILTGDCGAMIYGACVKIGLNQEKPYK